MFTHEELARLAYCPLTGKFNSTAQPDSTGYIRIRINGVKYKAHRLAWFCYHGQWPDGDIDHINGVRHDNRIANLRVVTNKQNHENRLAANRNNSTGLRGVSLHKKTGKYKAHIRHNGVLYYLGLYATPELALAVREQQERALFSHSPLHKENHVST